MQTVLRSPHSEACCVGLGWRITSEIDLFHYKRYHYIDKSIKIQAREHIY